MNNQETKRWRATRYAVMGSKGSDRITDNRQQWRDRLSQLTASLSAQETSEGKHPGGWLRRILGRFCAK